MARVFSTRPPRPMKSISFWRQDITVLWDMLVRPAHRPVRACSVRNVRCRLQHIFARNWQIATGSSLDWPKPTFCANWPVARSLGGYFCNVHFLLFVCLPVLSVCRHSSRSLVIGQLIDQCSRLY